MTIQRKYIDYADGVSVCKECRWAEKYIYRPRHNKWYLRCTRHTKQQIDVITGMTRVLGHFACGDVNDGHCKLWERRFGEVPTSEWD